MYSVAHYNIRRGIIDAPGLVRFNITEGMPDSYDRKIKDDRYYFVSEFKPSGKELFMYDYVDMFHDQAESKFIPENYEFTDQRKALKVKARIPRFKDQLLMDYPDLH